MKKKKIRRNIGIIINNSKTETEFKRTKVMIAGNLFMYKLTICLNNKTNTNDESHLLLFTFFFYPHSSVWT